MLGFQFIPNCFCILVIDLDTLKLCFDIGLYHLAKCNWKAVENNTMQSNIPYITFHVTFSNDNYLWNQLTHFWYNLYWHCWPAFRISEFILRCANPNVLEHDIGDWAPIQQHAYRGNPHKREKLRSEVESYYGYCRSFLLISNMSVLRTTWLLIVSRVGSQKVLCFASELPWITVYLDCMFFRIGD